MPANTPCKWCDTPLSDCDAARPNRKCCPDCRHHKRIQRKRTAGWQMPKGAIYVGRPTRWGNPWVVHIHSPSCGPELLACPDCIAEDRADAATKYRHAVLYPLAEQPPVPTPDEIRAELRGRDLACWCPLDQPCHADVLLEIANATTESEVSA
ncbi:Uncharacterised protein [Mycobacteroides abscessus subsp. abscessus]|nr:Uncharacterised protein [Mycobacteroides abscessus subsp. abscessus]